MYYYHQNSEQKYTLSCLGGSGRAGASGGAFLLLSDRRKYVSYSAELHTYKVNDCTSIVVNSRTKLIRILISDISKVS
jgi:hypothetical protein